MIKNIKKLIVAFLKGYIDKYEILNKRGKLNFKSVYVVTFIAFSAILIFLTQYAIEELAKRGQENIFLNIYFGIITIFLIFQTIISGINSMYFSDDLEILLPMPLRPIEILTTKMGMSLIQLLVFECITLLFPMILYGVYSSASIFYYILMPIAVILYSICLVLVNTIINLFIINLIKIIKRRELFQILCTVMVIAMVTVIEIATVYFTLKQENKLENLNLNVIVEQYNQVNMMNDSVINIVSMKNLPASLFTMIGVNLFLYFIIFVLAKKYINKILYTTQYRKKIQKNIITIKKCRSKNKNIAYLKNEFDKIIKNPIFLIQIVLPIISMQVVIISIVQVLSKALLNNINGIADELAKLTFNIEGMINFLIVYQIIIFFTGISLTSISRMGKEAKIMKIIPIKLYTQYVLKNIPEVLANIIISIIYVLSVNKIFPNIEIKYYIIGIIYMLLINIINSNILIYIDLKKPNLDWTNEYEIFTHNNNKIIQYALLTIECAVLWYISGVLKNMNIVKSLMMFIGVLIAILIGINIYIRKNIEKIFSQIN